MPRISVTHFTDPGCPFAYSAAPALTALRWRYGDQLAWRHVMIGLTEDAAQYAERGYTPLRMAQGNRRFRRFGMPFGRGPKQSLSATARACRAVIAVRLAHPELEWAAFRSLQFTQFTTDLPIESDAALRDALARVPGIDAEALLRAVDSEPVTEAYEADRAEARTAAGSPTEFQGKAANTDGAVRYTAPSLLFEHEDGRTLEAGGFQSLDAYDVCIANLDTTLERRGAPEDVGELLDAFPEGLTAAEVATCLVPMPDFADAGRAVALPLGDDALWVSAGADRRARLGERLRPGTRIG
jgi:2-hydroxychromene-2-carboxylate isomerase